MESQTMLGSIWHLFELAMMAFHGFIWGKFILRRVWARLTVNSDVDVRPPIINLDVDIKSRSGIHDVQRGSPVNVNSLTSLFKEAYGDKIRDLIPMAAKAGFIIRNKDGSEEEIGMADLALAVQKPSQSIIVRNLFGE